MGGAVINPSDYQNGSIPDNTKIIETPDTIGKMMTTALPFMLPSLLIPFLAMFLKTFIGRTVVLYLLEFLSA